MLQARPLSLARGAIRTSSVLLNTPGGGSCPPHLSAGREADQARPRNGSWPQADSAPRAPRPSAGLAARSRSIRAAVVCSRARARPQSPCACASPRPGDARARARAPASAGRPRKLVLRGCVSGLHASATVAMRYARCTARHAGPPASPRAGRAGSRVPGSRVPKVHGNGREDEVRARPLYCSSPKIFLCACSEKMERCPAVRMLPPPARCRRQLCTSYSTRNRQVTILPRRRPPTRKCGRGETRCACNDASSTHLQKRHGDGPQGLKAPYLRPPPAASARAWNGAKHSEACPPPHRCPRCRPRCNATPLRALRTHKSGARCERGSALPAYGWRAVASVMTMPYGSLSTL